MGRAAVHARLRAGQCDSDAGEVVRPGGHAEGLRRRCGEAAGEKLGTAPVNRHVGNVGTLLGSPSLPCAQHGGGQARRRLWALGAGGAAVGVPARESRVHGEGRQGGRRGPADTPRRGGRRVPWGGGGGGYEESRPSCTDGRPRIGPVGLVICSTSSVIRRSCWLGGVGGGATRGPARPAWTARPPTTSRPCGARRPSSRSCGPA